MRGTFITLEGGEGAGKSTQAKLLANWLRDAGHNVVETREPGGTHGADAVRQLLLSNDVELTALSEAYLFAAARADHMERLITPALNAGKWVICDRFIDSSLAYQGAAGELGVERVRGINAEALEDTMPDLTLLLRSDPALGAARAIERDGAESDRFSKRDEAFHEAVAQGLDDLAEAEPERFAIVDASADIETVAAQIRLAVEERLF